MDFDIGEDSLRLKNGSWYIAGSSGSGKTFFLAKLIRNQARLFKKPYDHIIICYSQYQPIYSELAAEIDYVTLFEGVPSLSDVGSDNKLVLLICEDMMVQMSKGTELTVAFTRLRHASVHIVYTSQDPYYGGNGGVANRTALRNANYVCLLNMSRRSVVATLSRQITPETPKYILSAYEQAMEQPFNYLFLNLHPSTHKSLKIMSNIFPDDEPKYVYLPEVTRK
jgi:hypothetical protein